MDILIVVCYLIAVLAIGLWQGKKVKDLRTYAVSGRNYTSFIIFATLSASFIGGGFSMGNAEKVFRFGILNIAALWGFSMQQFLVAKFIAPRMERYNHAISVGDIMACHYGKIGQVFTGVFTFIFCAGILGAQVGATGNIFNILLGIPKEWGIFIGIGIVIIYNTVGGMAGVVATDVLQFVILSIGLPLTLVLGVLHAGGISHMVGLLPAGHLSIPGNYFTWLLFLSLFLTFLLGETLSPPYVQRLFLGKSIKHTVRGNMASSIFSIPFFVVTGAIGLVALSINPSIDPNLAMPYVIKEILPIGLRGLVIASVIAIVMSSADSFLNAASVSSINDVLRPLNLLPKDKRRDLLIAQFMNVLLGILSIVFALSIQSVIDILIYSYNFWAPVILVPLVSAIMGVRVSVRHFIAGTFGGVLGVLIWKVLLKNPYGVDGLIIGVLGNLVFFYFMVLFFPNKMAVNVDQNLTK